EDEVELLAKRRLGVVEPARHAGILVAQAGEQEDDLAPFLRHLAALPTRRLAEARDRRLPIAGDDRGAAREAMAAGGERPGDVREAGGLDLRMRRQMIRKPLGGGRERLTGPRRKEQRLNRPPRRRREREGGRLLEDGVDVRAAEPEGADAGAARSELRRPRARRRRHVERAPGEIEPRVRRLEVERRRD